MLSDLKKIKNQAKKDLEEIDSPEQLEAFRVKYLGRKGQILAYSKKIKNLSPKEKPEAGKILNSLKKELEKAYKDLAGEISSQGDSIAKDVDLTLPGKSRYIGRLHPMTQMNRKLTSLFKEMGFTFLDEHPEITTDKNIYDHLNFPKDHPARDSEDVLEIGLEAPGTRTIARSHLSEMVVLGLKKYGPPLKLFYNGRLYRNEATDAKHSDEFFQMEAWIVDEKEASFANAKYIMGKILERIFGRKVDVRIRTGFFPFVEPGFEGDFKCVMCEGKGCKTCGGEGWIEVFPGGNIHPNVLKAGGVDPSKYEGVAVNFGWERMCMLAHKIDDIRHFLNGDLRFVRQF